MIQNISIVTQTLTSLLFTHTPDFTTCSLLEEEEEEEDEEEENEEDEE